jgi:hypothetical protein
MSLDGYDKQQNYQRAAIMFSGLNQRGDVCYRNYLINGIHLALFHAFVSSYLIVVSK